MNLDFDLFISGSPNGDQRWPNNSEDLFCKQFFALDTDTSNDSDFFIEVLTSPEGQRCCYYSYVHRKDIFGLVNGNKRKGAYFAMILRFKGIFCNTPRNLYSLMDMVYRNKINGSILEKTSTGESYLIESFASKDDRLREIENLFASQLSVLVNNLKPLDSTFASSQSGKIISYNLYEKDDAIIMDALRKHLKVHLLAFTNDQSGIIDDFKSQLSAKEEKYSKLLKEKQSIESSFNEYRKEAEARFQRYQITIDSLEKDIKILIRQNDELKSQLQEVRALHEGILEYARKYGIDDVHSLEKLKRDVDIKHSDEEQTVGKKDWNYYIQKYWPFLAAIIIVFLVILLLFKIYGPDKKDKPSQRGNQLSECQEGKSNSDSERDQLMAFKDSLDSVHYKLSLIEQVFSGIIRADVEPINKGTIANKDNKAKIIPVLKTDNDGLNNIIWRIIEGNDNADQEGSYLNVNKNGEVKIILGISTSSNDWVEIPGTERTLMVIRSD